MGDGLLIQDFEKVYKPYFRLIEHLSFLFLAETTVRS